MSFKSETYTFKDLLSDIVDNRGKTCPVEENGMPLIATNCVKNDAIYPSFEKVRYVSRETYNNWFRGHPIPGDLIFVTKGSPGNVCLVPNPVPFCIAQDMVAIRANEKIISPKFLFALLRSRTVQQAIQNMHVGTLIPHFKKGDFDKLYLDIPTDFKVQDFIGNLYYDISLKIANNNRINKTLEEIAQALFKSWFVDFQPVKAKIQAKAEGKDPQIAAMCAISGKSEQELQLLPREKRDELAKTANLFPDNLVESELGLIPEGWELIPLYNTAEYVNGGAFKAKDLNESKDGLPIIKIAELKSGLSAQTKYTIKEVPEKYRINSDDMLYSWSGSPETSLEVFKWFGGAGWLNQHIFKINTKSKEQKVFVYFLLKYLKPQLINIAKNKQTTGLGHVTVADMKRLKVVVPNEISKKLITGHLISLFDNASNCMKQNSALSEQRDALLPKLLSGELIIND